MGRYDGNGSTGYANPHAATSIGGATQTYDNAGNLTSDGTWSHSWDHKNRLASSNGTVSTTYTDDHTTARVKKTTNGTTTRYSRKYFEQEGADSTAYIWAGDTLLATVGGTSTPETTYIHPDHLGSTNVTTDENSNTTSVLDYAPYGAENYSTGDLASRGYIGQHEEAAFIQLLDYYPYGAERISTGEDATDRHYIGERFDDETELNYLNARYYEGATGQFTSQDPVHLVVGDPAKVRQFAALDAMTLLSDPQALNSYAYGRGNPIRFSDPKGLWYVELATGGSFAVLSASTGLRVDGKGVEWFVSGGPAIGVSGPFEASFSSGNLSHEPEITVSRNAKFMAIAGMGISENGQYDYENPLSTGRNRQMSYSVNAGVGGGVSQEYTLSTPVMNYGSSNQKSAPQSSSLHNAASASNNSLVKFFGNLVSSLKAYVESQSQSTKVSN